MSLFRSKVTKRLLALVTLSFFSFDAGTERCRGGTLHTTLPREWPRLVTALPGAQSVFRRLTTRKVCVCNSERTSGKAFMRPGLHNVNMKTALFVTLSSLFFSFIACWTQYSERNTPWPLFVCACLTLVMYFLRVNKPIRHKLLRACVRCLNSIRRSGFRLEQFQLQGTGNMPC
jgi:hypothetical protein